MKVALFEMLSVAVLDSTSARSRAKHFDYSQIARARKSGQASF
jgi:hypothetical protein